MSVEEIAERFQRETANHGMNILHDDGLYRHVRFTDRTPGQSWAYWFDLITVPGALIFRGDGNIFAFVSSDDMFELFTRSSRYGINPSYWYQKLGDGRESAKPYSQEKFNQLVAGELAEDEEHWPGVTEAWAGHVEVYDTQFEEQARLALTTFEFSGGTQTSRRFRFYETDEWNLKDYDWWYLWACHAIVWGIGQYDAARSASTTEVAS